MARFPTPAELGTVQPTAVRQIGVADASGLGRGMESLGGALMGIADQEMAQRDTVETGAANARLITGLADVERKYKTDPNYQTFGTTAPKDTKAVVEAASGAIADPRKRALFVAHAGQTAARTTAGIDDLAASKERAATLAVAEGSLKDLSKVYTDPTISQEKRDLAFRSIVDTIDMNEKSGLFTPDVAAAAREAYVSGGKKQFLKNYAEDAARSGRPMLDLGVGTNGASAPAGGASGGRMDAGSVRSIFLDEVKKQGLVGFVPADGAKYGIKTGSAEEWANLFTGLAQHESGLDNQNVGDIGQFNGGSRGLLQLSYDDARSYGFNAGKPFTADQLANPAVNAAVGVAIAKQLMDKNGSIQGGMGKYWGPISKEGWVPGQGRDRNLPWQSWGANVAAGPTRAAAAQGGPQGDPRFADVSYQDRLAAQEIYDRTLHQRMVQQKAERSAFQGANKERFSLGIETEDPSVSRSSLLDANRRGMIDDGQAAELLKSLHAKEEQRGLANEMMDAIGAFQKTGEQRAFNPFDPKAEKGADVVMSDMVKAGVEPLKAVDEIQKSTGIVPSKAVSALRGALVGTDPVAAANALQIANNLMVRNPNVFAGSAGGQDISNKTALFNHYVGDLGFDARAAAERVQRADDPQARGKVKISDDEAKAFKDSITKASKLTGGVGGAFDASNWPGNPAIGQTDAIHTQMLQDYAELSLMFYRDGYGKDEAKAMAAAQLKGIWGVSHIQGTAWNGTVMKYPPELRYPQARGEDGSIGYGYITEQARDFVKEKTGKDVDKGSIILTPIPTRTRAAWDQRGPVPYEVMYTTKDKDTGQTLMGVVSGVPFTADPAKANSTQQRKVDAANAAAQAEAARVQAEGAAARAAVPQAPTPTDPNTLKAPRTTAAQREKMAAEADATANADYGVRMQMKADKAQADMSVEGLRRRQSEIQSAPVPQIEPAPPPRDPRNRGSSKAR